MRALILSCNTGGGHNSCAYAIKEIFEEQGEYCEIADALRFISRGVSGFMEKGHAVMYRHYPWFFRWGYVQDVSLLMDSADVYMTKPGGLSTTEAAMKKLPMVFVNAVAGCEEYNSRFYILRGCATTADSVEMLADVCAELLGNEKKQMEMALHCENVSKENSSRLIFEYIRRTIDEDRKTECGL